MQQVRIVGEPGECPTRRVSPAAPGGRSLSLATPFLAMARGRLREFSQKNHNSFAPALPDTDGARPLCKKTVCSTLTSPRELQHASQAGAGPSMTNMFANGSLGLALVAAIACGCQSTGGGKSADGRPGTPLELERLQVGSVY